MHVVMNRFQCLLIIPLSLLCLIVLAGCHYAPAPGLSSGSEQPETVDRNCAYFYFLWGRHAELALNFQEALEVYEKVLICDPEADYIARKIPVLLLRLDRGEEAVTWLNNYLESKPDESGSRMLLAKILIRMGRFNEAAVQYRIVHERNPEDENALLLLSELYMHQGQPIKARKTLLEILKANARSYPARVLLARLYMSLKQYDKALVEYHKTLKMNWSTDLLFEISQVYLHLEQYDKAIKSYGEILQHDKRNESARIALVNVYLLQKKDEQALLELNKLKTGAEHSTRVDLIIARLYAKLKKYDQAIEILQTALEQGNTAEARYLLAVMYFMTEHYDQSLAELKRIGRDSAEYKNALFLQVRIFRVRNNLQKAVELFEHVIGQEDGAGRSADMYVLLAGLYQLQGRNDLVRSTFDRGLAIFPNDDQLLYEYGLFLDTSGEPDKAMSIMQKVIKVKSNHAAALNYVGYSWADKRVHLDQALNYIKRAVALKPDNGYIRDSLGWVYYRLGRNKEALDALELAVKLLSGDPTIYTHLGDVLLELGRTKKALEAYREAISLIHEDNEARKSLQKKVKLLGDQSEP